MRGVTFNNQTRKWRAKMRGYGARGYIGEYATEAQAQEARRAAELLIDGRYHDHAEIEVSGDIARIPLFTGRGELVGWTAIDAFDVPLVEGHRWCVSPNGYAVSRIGGKAIAMHIVLLPGSFIRDHINGDQLDNRRLNLRPCTHAQNCRNARLPKNNSSGFKGVRLTAGGRFNARITINRIETHLGVFGTAEAAGRAYDAAAVQHFGEFARLNFPEALAPQDIAA